MTSTDGCGEKHLDVITKFIQMKICMDRVLSPITQRYGLTPMLSMTLNLIAGFDNPTIGSVFRTLELNQGNVSSMCKKLEKEGFITRNKSPEDERQVNLKITEKGRKALEGIGREICCLKGNSSIISEADTAEAEKGIDALTSFAQKLTAEMNLLEQ